jgi:hypothetical protein
MTPYGRDGPCGCVPPIDFDSRGFVRAVVDIRGTVGSEGNLDQNYFSPAPGVGFSIRSSSWGLQLKPRRASSR